jgi:hypothetical protein
MNRIGLILRKIVKDIHDGMISGFAAIWYG